MFDDGDIASDVERGHSRFRRECDKGDVYRYVCTMQRIRRCRAAWVQRPAVARR